MSDRVFSSLPPAIRVARALAMMRATPLRLAAPDGTTVARIYPDGEIEMIAPVPDGPVTPVTLEWEEEE